MTSRRASVEGTLGRYPPESPTSDAAPTHLESNTPGTATTSTGTGPAAPIARRRPLRAKSTSNAPLSSHLPLWVDTDPGDSRKAKGARINARRASGVESPRSSVSPQTSASELDVPSQEKEKDVVGFLPKLSRILEGKESKALRRRRSSTVSSIDDSTPARRRRRPAEDAVTRRPIRQKHASLQRRAESLANLTNPSLVSVLSGVTQQSSASSGSNSTITQKSYDKNHVSKRRLAKERKRLQTKQDPQKVTAMASETPSVFQYMDDDVQHNAGSDGNSDVKAMNRHGDALEHTSREGSGNANWAWHDKSKPEHVSTEGSPHIRPSSSSSSASSRNSDSDGGNSSNGEEPSGESPMTSPASTRMSGAAAMTPSEARRFDRGTHSKRDRSNSDSSISVRESSPGGTHPEVYMKHQMHIEEPEDEEDEDSDSSGEDDDVDGADDHEVDHEQMHHLALERAAPPRLPSASSSRHSDPHTRRLRNQEQELREHVLQNPQPHRDFRYEGGPSPNAHPAMPLYDIQSYSGASPDNYHVPAAHTPMWPPPAPPPPPPIGYYSPTYNAPPVPYFPGPDNSYAMASRPPVATVQQPPFYAHGQPPHYQQHPASPDMTKTTVVGYELLADRLAEVPKDKDDGAGTEETNVIPMYRKFEQLNHRVLLHLQDEISELEEELRYVDESIAQSSPGAETGSSHPASRRGESRYGGELHYRRTDLLGRIYLKLGQYNQALSSFSGMLKNLDPAKAEDIQAYRAWMEEHAPIEAAETRFLERKNDLLAVTRRRSAANVGGVWTRQSAAVGVPLMAVLPLMAFTMVPSLAGRLFIIALIGSAEVMVVTSTELVDLMTVREWVICASIYFGMMALLAGVVQ